MFFCFFLMFVVQIVFFCLIVSVWRGVEMDRLSMGGIEECVSNRCLIYDFICVYLCIHVFMFCFSWIVMYAV